MKINKREQYRLYVEKWKRAGPELEKFRRSELRALDTRAEVSGMDALADIGLRFGTPRKTSGLVEMQAWFMKFARKQGLLPAAVREASADYETTATGMATSHQEQSAPSKTTAAGRRLVCSGAGIPPGPKLALFCSVKCPGKLIQDTYDLCLRLRAKGVVVVSGFHSPMEQECLRVLLQSPNPVIWCLARAPLKAVPRDFRRAADAGRLVLVSSFPEKVHRVTAETALIRNRIVAELAAAVIVAHAAPGSKLAALCREILAAGIPLYTFDHPANAALLAAGAKPIAALDLAALTHH